MSCTEKQAAANKLNAQKSTGPTSPEGKAASRANARKHGMTSEVVVLPTEDVDAFAAEERLWIDELAPDGGLAERAAQRAFRAYVQLQRCDRSDDHDLLMRTLNAKDDWDIRRAEYVADSTRRIYSEPSVALAELRSTAEGCKWLHESWRTQRNAADSGVWNMASYRRMVALLGIEYNGYEELFHWTQWIELADAKDEIVAKNGMDPDADPEELEKLTPEFREEWVEARRERRQARVELVEYCDDKIAEFQLREVELTPLSERSRTGAENRALFDDSSEGKLRRRYAAEAERSMHRNMKEAKALSKAEAQARVEIPRETPIPVPTPEMVVPLPEKVPPVPPSPRNEPAEAPPVSRNEPAEECLDTEVTLDSAGKMSALEFMIASMEGRLGTVSPVWRAE